MSRLLKNRDPAAATRCLIAKLLDNLGIIVVRYWGDVIYDVLQRVFDELSAMPGFRKGLKAVAGGAVGGVIGSWAAKRLAACKTMLIRAFAVVVAAVGIYVVARGIGTLI